MKRAIPHRLEPESARKKIAFAKSNEPFMAALLDRDHRGHRDAVDQWSWLHQAAFPASASSLTASGKEAGERHSDPTAPSQPVVRSSNPPKQTQQGTAMGPQFRQIDAYPGGPQGPIVTFYNDDPSRPNTDRPIRAELAEAVEAAALRVGLNVNINSSRRSNSGPHSEGRAVDINRINDMRVDDPANRANVERLQREFMTLPNVNQVLGPVYNVNIDPSGGQKPVTDQGIINQHRNHLHINVRR
jgi:hypothetical protein